METLGYPRPCSLSSFFHTISRFASVFIKLQRAELDESKNPPHARIMGQQYNATQKRSRRKRYLKKKKQASKAAKPATKA